MFREIKCGFKIHHFNNGSLIFLIYLNYKKSRFPQAKITYCSTDWTKPKYNIFKNDLENVFEDINRLSKTVAWLRLRTSISHKYASSYIYLKIYIFVKRIEWCTSIFLIYLANFETVRLVILYIENYNNPVVDEKINFTI